MLKAKVFKSGNSQAIRLPKEFQLNQKEVWLEKVNDTLIIHLKPATWQDWSENLSAFSSDFMGSRNQPMIQDHLSKKSNA